MILTEVEIDIERAFDNLSSAEKIAFTRYVFDNSSEFERKILLSYIAANYPDSVQFIKEY